MEERVSGGAVEGSAIVISLGFNKERVLSAGQCLIMYE